MALDVDAELERLGRMTVKELQREFERVWQEPTRSHNKRSLIKRVIWRLQALDEGWCGHPARVMERAHAIADFGVLRSRPPTGATEASPRVRKRLPSRDLNLPPVGTVLRREHRGRVVECVVREHGFEHGGEVFKSLSAAARVASGGGHWNGWTFWRVKGARD